MKFDKSHIVSGSIGVILGAFSMWEIETISGNHAAFFSSNEKETTIYEKVNEDPDGDVYITPKGKKNHALGCYILRKSEEFKLASRSSVIEVGYTPCKKCKP